MAIMIPSNPEFSSKSYESVIFNALKKLPPDCFVLHSLSILDPESEDGIKKETEIDFVVIIPNIGCVVIEAKSGRVKFTNEVSCFEGNEIPPFTWVYESGRPMKGNGPFRQSRDNMYALISYLNNTNYSDLAKKQKFYNCIWFHQATRNVISSLPQRPECPKSLILTKESLNNPYESLLKVIEYQNSLFFSNNRKPWDFQSISLIVSHVLAPSMNLVPGKNWEYEFKNDELNRLLIEQERILEFLSEQKIAVISGAAGTGKTMIALKKAELEANEGKNVLFLCFNSALSSHLSKNYPNKNIAYFNIAEWACFLCSSHEPDYGALSIKLDTLLIKNQFPYNTIIVDEAQDFGQEIMDNESINVLQKLHDAMLMLDGTMYLFYDKNQVVNADKLPLFIKDADCKLSLYRNCRNTKKIADSSIKLLHVNSKLGPNCVIGETPHLVITERAHLNDALSSQIIEISKKYTDIVVLSTKTINSSSFFDLIEGHSIKINGKYYPFYTCRQYKGLEADAVILVDVDKHTFENFKNQLIYYVGTSRAKFMLSIIAEMDEKECEESCRKLLKDAFIENINYKEEMSMALATELI